MLINVKKNCLRLSIIYLTEKNQKNKLEFFPILVWIRNRINQDPRIWIWIHTKMKWIRNTAKGRHT